MMRSETVGMKLPPICCFIISIWGGRWLMRGLISFGGETGKLEAEGITLFSMGKIILKNVLHPWIHMRGAAKKLRLSILKPMTRGSVPVAFTMIGLIPDWPFVFRKRSSLG